MKKFLILLPLLFIMVLTRVHFESLLATDTKSAPKPASKKSAEKPSAQKNVRNPMPVGAAKTEITIGDTKFDLYTYKPKNYKDGPLILVFHGLKRNAEGYRDSAIELADKVGAIVAAPLFDTERFPTRLYQHGGIYTADLKVVPREQWTWSYVAKIADKVRQQEGKLEMPYYLIGHSAGGQFLVRYAGFMKTDAKRIVAANPGSELFPTDAMPYPYGYGVLPKELAKEENLKQYLAQPLTLFLGTNDTNKDDDNLDKSILAKKQGASRYERGHNAFKMAEQLAKKNGWEFNWRIVEAKDVGHTAKGMFGDPMCEKAMFGEKGK